MGVVEDLDQACLAVVPRVVRLVLLAMVGSKKKGKEQPKGRDGVVVM